MRVTSSLWIGAYIRRCCAEGAMATVAYRGAEAAGAIFVKVNRLDGTFDLYGPAPQSAIDQVQPLDRRFEKLLDASSEVDIDTRIDRERNFDSDLWVIEIEDRGARHFIDVV